MGFLWLMDSQLNEAVDQSKEVSEAFSNEVAKEIEFFQAVKVADFKTFLRDYADSQLEFHEKVGVLPPVDCATWFP